MSQIKHFTSNTSLFLHTRASKNLQVWGHSHDITSPSSIQSAAFPHNHPSSSAHPFTHQP